MPKDSIFMLSPWTLDSLVTGNISAEQWFGYSWTCFVLFVHWFVKATIAANPFLVNVLFIYSLKTPKHQKISGCLTEILLWPEYNNNISKDFKRLPGAMHYHSLLTTSITDTPKPLLILIVEFFGFSLIDV